MLSETQPFQRAGNAITIFPCVLSAEIYFPTQYLILEILHFNFMQKSTSARWTVYIIQEREI